MTSVRMAFRFFVTAMLLAGFALPSMAASPEKTYSIRTSPSYNGSGTLSSGTNKAVIVTIRNETPPSATNSQFQAVKVWAPAGITAITGWDPIPGVNISTGDSNKSITLKKVGPIGPGSEFTFKIYVTVGATSSCEVPPLNWSGVSGDGTGTGAPVVRTGSALNGDDFVPRATDNSFWYPITNVQPNCSMAFDPGPHAALAGGLIGPVTVKGSPASAFGGTNVTLKIDGASATGGGPVRFADDGTAVFLTITANSVPVGTQTLTATSTVAGVNTLDATFAVTANNGTLACWDGTGTQPTNTKFSKESATDPTVKTEGSRFLNKDLSRCDIIPYTITLSNNDRKLEIIWDEVAQPNVVLQTETQWPPELVGPQALPKPTKYNVTGILEQTYFSATCLSKDPPKLIGTLGQALSATTAATETSIAISFDPATTETTKYPFPIVVESAPGYDPERMLVKKLAVAGVEGVYTVARQAGGVAHVNGVKVLSTPVPLSKDIANGPVGFPVPVCIVEETFTTKSFDACSGQAANSEPVGCIGVKSKLFIVGDVFIARD